MRRVQHNASAAYTACAPHPAFSYLIICLHSMQCIPHHPLHTSTSFKYHTQPLFMPLHCLHTSPSALNLKQLHTACGLFIPHHSACTPHLNRLQTYLTLNLFKSFLEKISLLHKKLPFTSKNSIWPKYRTEKCFHDGTLTPGSAFRAHLQVFSSKYLEEY